LLPYQAIEHNDMLPEHLCAQTVIKSVEMK